MSTYEIVVFVIAVCTAIIGCAHFVRSGAAFSEIGRQGAMWFEHPADREIADRPSEDELDSPIPRRPLRGRIS